MIGSLRGVVLERSPSGTVLIEVGGVGYRVTVPASSMAALGEPGAPTFLHIHTHVREDAIVLFGFASRDERQCFEHLLGAHGVLARHGGTLDGNVLFHDLHHTLVDFFQIIRCKSSRIGEVVIKAVFYYRTDGDLSVGVELFHRMRQQVGAGVAQYIDGFSGLIRDDTERYIAIDFKGQIDELVIHFARKGGFSQSRAYTLRNVFDRNGRIKPTGTAVR